MFRRGLAGLLVVCFLVFSQFSCSTSNDGGGDSGDSVKLQQSKELAQIVVIIAFGFSGALVPANLKAGEFPEGPCANGGSITPNPDGGVTFNNCSPIPGLELRGTIKEEIDQDGNIDSTYENFGGNFMGNEFNLDGTIKQENGPNGTDDFFIDLNITTTDPEEGTSNYNVEGELNLDDDLKLDGQMRFNNNGFSSECNFNNADALQLIQGDSGDAFDQNCNETNNGVPFA